MGGALSSDVGSMYTDTNTHTHGNAAISIAIQHYRKSRKLDDFEAVDH